MTQILKLDAAGQPVGWINYERAAYYMAKGLVLWDMGTGKQVLRGGHNCLGEQSIMELPTIMAVKGAIRPHRHGRTIPLDKEALLRRDRNMCAYCGQMFKDHQLEMEHVVPESRGGQLSWMNIVSADRGCNARKGNRTPEEAGMPLLYLPYVPNMHEGLILRNRRILADQMEFLSQGLPAHSRIRPH